MSNVFVSHSSRDKPFVRKLAAALLSEGFPVWLDSWELQVGDSLLDEIYDGIDASSVVLLVISQHSIESGWVNRELNAALAKEQQVGRKFLVPIKIDECNLPLKVADRLYADFSSSFSAPFSTLARALVTKGCRDLAVAPERELIALNFTNAVHLDTASFKKALRYIKRRQKTISLEGRQIVVNQDEVYELLFHQLHSRIDNIADDPFFSPELENAIRGHLDSIVSNERHLSNGVALLVANNRYDLDEAYWFARILKGRNAYDLWSAQKPGGPIQYGKEWRCAFLGNNSEAAEFFEVENVTLVHLWDEGDPSKVVVIWMDTNDLTVDLDLASELLVKACKISAIEKYVYPQMVLKHLRGMGPVLWNLDKVVAASP